MYVNNYLINHKRKNFIRTFEISQNQFIFKPKILEENITPACPTR